MLKEKSAAYGLNNIQFIDSVPKDQVGDYINASDVCMAILKKTDTFKTVYPNKVFDYMCCKKPSLVTIDGITRELLETSEAGLYAEPENIDAFEKQINIFATMDEASLQKMGENGYTFVKEHFDRKKLAEKYMAIVKEVIHD